MGDDDLLATRSKVHGALADPTRLAIVDELNVSDRTPSELSHRFGLPGNLLVHHLDMHVVTVCDRAHEELDPDDS